MTENRYRLNTECRSHLSKRLLFSFILSVCCSAQCVITDLDEFVPLMQLNIDANSHLLKGSIRAEALCWGSHTSGRFCFPDYVLLADCIYYKAVCVPPVFFIFLLYAVVC